MKLKYCESSCLTTLCRLNCTCIFSEFWKRYMKCIVVLKTFVLRIFDWPFWKKKHACVTNKIFPCREKFLSNKWAVDACDLPQMLHLKVTSTKQGVYITCSFKWRGSRKTRTATTATWCDWYSVDCIPHNKWLKKGRRKGD